MQKQFKIITALCLSALVLAACDDSDNLAGGGDASGAVAQFGAQFAAIFNADRNGDPANIDDVVISFMGVNGPNFTADPVNF